MKRAYSIILVAMLSVFAAAIPSQSRAETAGEHVAKFQAGLIAVMKDAKELGVSGRYQRLEPVVKNAFNLPLMAGLAAGSHWQGATEDQRQRLVMAFSRMSIATLATLFSGYSGEVFTVKAERAGPQNITFVDTKLFVPGRGSDVEIAYVARMSDSNWRLIDVIIDGGISELKVRISEYSQTLQKGGIEALIRLLNNKADELLA